MALTDTPRTNRDHRTLKAGAAGGQTEEPNGAAAAALLAGGGGCAIFGTLVLLSEAVPSVHEAPTISEAVGPLSGKSVVGVVAWLMVWAVLHGALGKREVSMKAVVNASWALVGLGFVLTFPPVFLRFAAT